MNRARFALAAVSALTTVASAQAVGITSATRSIETQAFGYDRDFNNGEADASSMSRTARRS